MGDGEKQVYFNDSRTTSILEKEKVLLKLTSEKTLVVSDVLHVTSIKINLIYVTLLVNVRVKVSFEYDNIVVINVSLSLIFLKIVNDHETLMEKFDFRNIKGNETQATCK